MRFQLVLQWPAASIEDFDVLIDMEETLEEHLSAASEVDGHDVGSGEINIFVHTDDPVGALAEIERILGNQDVWADARVAYRELKGEKYIILRPTSLTEFKVT
jgi:hypothetical protein